MNQEQPLPTADDLALLLWLNAVPRVGPAAARLLLAHFTTPLRVFQARSYVGVDGLRPHVVEELTNAPRTLDAFLREAEAILDRVRALDVAIITPLMASYPPQLMKHTAYGPTILYVAGDPSCLALPGGAIVGTRSPSQEARNQSRAAAGQLAQHGWAVFSGMAKGIDTEAHHGALDAGGKTVAVLGCGVDRAYPAENAELYERIRTLGAVVSEYVPGAPPSPENLRRRNRLIVGLSNVVVVAECPSNSGAMIAARAALQQHRPILVLDLKQDGFARERSGTELLAKTELAARWDGADLAWLDRYQQTYRRPPSAETRLDEALGKPARSAGTKPDAESSRPQRTPAVQVADAAQPQRDEAMARQVEPPVTPPLPTTSADEPPAAPPAAPVPRELVNGQRVRHPKFGIGTIRAIHRDPPGSLEIRFDTGGTRKIGLNFAGKLELLTE